MGRGLGQVSTGMLGDSGSLHHLQRPQWGHRFRQAGVDGKAGHLGQGRQLTSESLPKLGAGGSFQEDLGR